MSDEIVLTPRALPSSVFEAECIAPDRFATLGEAEISALPVWLGAHTVELGELFEVRGGRQMSVRIDGDVPTVDGIGSAMAGGTLHIQGSAGRGLGAGMSAGTIEVGGDVGDDAGSGMSGGVIRANGSAGDRLGAARPGAARGMSGGEIVVLGSAGADVAAAARRGVVVVCGNAGERAGRSMIAGSVIVLGSAGRGAGRWSKRGTLVAMGSVEVPPTYRYACTFRPPHLRLTLAYLRARYSLSIEDRYVGGLYRRFSGDLAELGKGEILQWTRE